MVDSEVPLEDLTPGQVQFIESLAQIITLGEVFEEGRAEYGSGYGRPDLLVISLMYKNLASQSSGPMWQEFPELQIFETDLIHLEATGYLTVIKLKETFDFRVAYKFALKAFAIKELSRLREGKSANQSEINSGQHMELRRFLDLAFNFEEFRMLCSDIGIDADNVKGYTKIQKMDELLHLLRRENRTDSLTSHETFEQRRKAHGLK